MDDVSPGDGADAAKAPNRLARLWDRVPVLVRAVVVGELILAIGGLPELLLFVNLKLAPSVPWSLLATMVWLWLCWRYLDGAGWPRSTSRQRRRDLRARPLPPRIWGWALLAGGFGMVSVDALAFLTPRLAHIPREAFRLPVDLAAVPVWTTWSLLLAISVFAGVLEEAAFRGYMLSRLERRHGWLAAIVITGVVFFADHHFSHAYATWAYLPFFLAVSVLHGVLVYLTRSILPSVVLHAVADFVVIPIQYGIVGDANVSALPADGVDAALLTCVGVLVIFGLASVPAFLRLRLEASRLRLATPEEQPVAAVPG